MIRYMLYIISSHGITIIPHKSRILYSSGVFWLSLSIYCWIALTNIVIFCYWYSCYFSFVLYTKSDYSRIEITRLSPEVCLSQLYIVCLWQIKRIIIIIITIITIVLASKAVPKGLSYGGSTEIEMFSIWNQLGDSLAPPSLWFS